MGIIVTKAGAKARKLDRSVVTVESDLQRYIVENPECLPVEEIQNDLRLLIVAREFPTESGPIDALGIDQEGGIYVVETKLYKNPDKRKVIAQVLDYGAALWRDYGHAAESFVESIDRAIQKTSSVSLELKAQEFFGLDEEDGHQLHGALSENLMAGRLRFVVLMDQLDDRLRNLISLVNSNSKFTVYGVELEFYKFDEYTVVIPRLHGAEATKPEPPGPSSGRRDWDEETFFENAKGKLSADALAAVKDLYNFSIERASTVSWGTGIRKGSFSPKFDAISPKSIYSVYSDGRLDLNFRWLRHTESGRRAVAGLAKRLREAGFILPDDPGEKFVGIRPEAWVPRLTALKGALGGVVEEAVSETRKEEALR